MSSAVTPDPRVVRTRAHVIGIALKLVSEDRELSFASLAAAARVSRKTLYSHFSSLTGLVSVLIQEAAFGGFHTTGLTGRPLILQVVGEIAAHLQGPVRPLIGMLFEAAQHDPAARELLVELEVGMHQLLADAGMPLTEPEYAVVVGALTYDSLTRGGPIPDPLVDYLVEMLDDRV